MVGALSGPRPLERQEVVHYLLERGLVSPEAVVRADARVFAVERRNRGYRVESTSGPSHFVKQAAAVESAATVATEAAVLQRFAGLPSGSPLRRYLPAYRAYDVESCILVTELAIGSMTLHDQLASGRALRPGIGLALADAILALHELEPPPASVDAVPGALLFHRPDSRILSDVTSANMALISAIQRNRGLRDGLDSVVQAWVVTCTIHADLRWDNVVVLPSPQSARPRPLVWLVDWEMSCHGDPRWDIASVLAAPLAVWALSVGASGEPSTQTLKRARYPLHRSRPLLNSFWRRYTSRTGRVMETDEVMRFVAARLVQSAYEAQQYSSRLSAGVAVLVQLAANILQRPAEAAERLIGLQG